MVTIQLPMVCSMLLPHAAMAWPPRPQAGPNEAQGPCPMLRKGMTKLMGVHMDFMVTLFFFLVILKLMGVHMDFMVTHGFSIV